MNDQELQLRSDPRTLGMSNKEIDDLNAYIEAGIPGVTTAKSDAIVQMMQLFMEGYTYGEICNKVRVKKEIVLYCGFKYGWAVAKQAYADSLLASLDSKIQIQNLENANFIIESSRFLRKYFQEKIDEYERTKDASVLKGVNFKLLDKYVKLIGIMNGDQLNTPPQAPQVPGQSLTVNVHAASGSAVNIKPSEGKVDQGSLLKGLADLERAKEEATNRRKDTK